MESRTLACRIGGRSVDLAVGLDAVDLAFLFLSPAHLDEVETAAEAAVREELAPRHLLGRVAEGVLAGVRGLEVAKARSAFAVHSRSV